MATDSISYNRADLNAIKRAFKGMEEEATNQAKQTSSQLADFVRSKVIDRSSTVSRNRVAAQRIAQGAVVSKSSKVGEISYGFARQRFSGGGSTQKLWAGNEFGSNRFKQFPNWSGREGRGSKGWFIYPTLRSIQPDIVRKWEEAFSKIVKRFD